MANDEIFRITSDVIPKTGEFAGKLSFLRAEELPKAQALALNRSLRIAQDFIRAKLETRGKPIKRYVLNSFWIEKAKPGQLSGTLYMARKISKYGETQRSTMFPEANAGERTQIHTEYLLSERGIIPSGGEIIGSHAAPRDQYGNVKPAVYIKALSNLKAFREVGFLMNRRRKGYKQNKPDGSMFAGLPRNHKAAFWAIWMRKGGSLVPIFLQIHTAHYRKTFAYYDDARNVVNSVIEDEFKQAWADCLAWAGLK